MLHGFHAKGCRFQLLFFICKLDEIIRLNFDNEKHKK